MNKRSKIIWIFFISSIIIIAIDAFFIISGKNCPEFFNIFKFYFPAFVVFIHILATLRLKKGLLFIMISSITGLLFEIIGTRYGNLVATGYTYNQDCYNIFFLDIPLLIPIYWTLFIYTAYSITNSFLLWKQKEKPSQNSPLEKERAIVDMPRGSLVLFVGRLLRPIKALYKLILLDASIVLSIDLFMDPILVNLENWQWQDTGFYFDIPTLNFFGWFAVALIASTIFRSIEYYYPTKIKLHYSIFLIPLIGYFSLYLIFAIMAYSAELYLLITINSAIMLPIIILNIKNFFKYKKP